MGKERDEGLCTYPSPGEDTDLGREGHFQDRESSTVRGSSEITDETEPKTDNQVFEHNF